MTVEPTSLISARQPSVPAAVMNRRNQRNDSGAEEHTRVRVMNLSTMLMVRSKERRFSVCYTQKHKQMGD